MEQPLQKVKAQTDECQELRKRLRKKRKAPPESDDASQQGVVLAPAAQPVPRAEPQPDGGKGEADAQGAQIKVTEEDINKEADNMLNDAKPSAAQNDKSQG